MCGVYLIQSEIRLVISLNFFPSAYMISNYLHHVFGESKENAAEFYLE